MNREKGSNVIGRKQMILFVAICVLVVVFYCLGIPLTFTGAADWAVQRAGHLPGFGGLDSNEPQEPVKESKYQLVVETLSWSEAKLYAEEYAPEKGSHLAVVTSEEEWQMVEELLTETFGMGNAYVWLGASSDDEGKFHWVNGETFDYAPWGNGEPSYWDQDGTREAYLCAWNIHNRWEWNDQRDELPTVLSNPDGKVAMVIEYYE